MNQLQHLQVQNTIESQKDDPLSSQAKVQAQIHNHATHQEPVEKDQQNLIKKTSQNNIVVQQNNLSNNSLDKANLQLENDPNPSELAILEPKNQNKHQEMQLQQVQIIIESSQQSNIKKVEKIAQIPQQDVQNSNNNLLDKQREHSNNNLQKGQANAIQSEEKLQMKYEKASKNVDILVQNQQHQSAQSLNQIKPTQQQNHTKQIEQLNIQQQIIQKSVEIPENKAKIQDNQSPTKQIQLQVSEKANQNIPLQQNKMEIHKIQQPTDNMISLDPITPNQNNLHIQNQNIQLIKYQQSITLVHENINKSVQDHKQPNKQNVNIQQDKAYHNTKQRVYSFDYKDQKQNLQQQSKVHQEPFQKDKEINNQQNAADIKVDQSKQQQEDQRQIHQITNYRIESNQHQSQNNQYSQNKNSANIPQQNKLQQSKTIEVHQNEQSQQKQKYRLHSQYFQSLPQQKHEDKQVILFTQFSQNQEPTQNKTEQVTNLLQIKEETSSITNINPLQEKSLHHNQGSQKVQNVQANLLIQEPQKHQTAVPTSSEIKQQKVKEDSPKKEGVGKIAKRTVYQKKVYQIVKDLTKYDQNKNVIPILDQPRRAPKNKINLSKLDSHIELQSNVLSLTIGQIMSKNEDAEANKLLQQIDLLKQNLRQLQKKKQSRQYESPSRIDENPNNTISSHKRHKKQLTGRIYRKFQNQTSRVSEQIQNHSREQTYSIPIEPFTINSAPRNRFFSTNGFQGFKPKQQQKIDQFGKKGGLPISFRVKRPSKTHYGQKEFDSLQKQAGFIKNKSKQEEDQCFQARPLQNYQRIQFADEDKLGLIQKPQPRQLQFTPNFREEVQKYFLVLNLQPPNREMTQEELVELANAVFKKFGVDIQSEKAAVLSVKKYKNCVSFTLDSDRTILWYYEGKFYYGGWIINRDGEGEKNGWGYEQVTGKYIYNGSYKGNKKQGYGVIKFTSKQKDVVYEGFWVNGLKQGKGRQLQSDGIEYIGSWLQGKKHGQGKIIISQKQSFTGNFIRGVKNGYGKQIFKNGDTFEGQYVDGKFSGKGIYTWSNLSRYQGQFKNGARNGHGIWVGNYTDPNSDRYQGQYKNDKKSGFGLYRWKDGTSYEGQFLNDLKHGQGVVSYGDGRTARLQWNQGVVMPRHFNRQSTSKKANSRSNSQKSQNSKNLVSNTHQILLASQSRSKPTRISLGMQKL